MFLKENQIAYGLMSGHWPPKLHQIHLMMMFNWKLAHTKSIINRMFCILLLTDRCLQCINECSECCWTFSNHFIHETELGLVLVLLILFPCSVSLCVTLLRSVSCSTYPSSPLFLLLHLLVRFHCSVHFTSFGSSSDSLFIPYPFQSHAKLSVSNWC